MIARLRALCRRDGRITGAVIYGSFALGEGDAYSDIDAALFVADDALSTLDQQAWIAEIAPVALYFDDEFGHHTALFTNLVRGEFHFEPASGMARVAAWQGNAWFPDPAAALLVDRTGELARHLAPLVGGPPERDTPAGARYLATNLINSIVFGTTILRRGEVARALEILGHAHRFLLWMARLLEHTTVHWPTPARAAERDLSATAYQRYVACTAPAHYEMLGAAYRSSWTWGREMIEALAQRHDLGVPAEVLAQIDRWMLAPETP
jgi:lincosamide nucleotidyltransferase